MARTVDRAVVPPAPAALDAPGEAKAPLAQQASGFMADNWRWIAALALLALAALVWVWRTRFGAYDSAGLPRGPKL